MTVRLQKQAPASQPTPDQASKETQAPVVRVRNLAKRFRRESGETTVAVDDVSFDLVPGEFLVLLGPSGCGKTTLLRAIAGLDRPDEGTIEIHGRPIFSSEKKLNVPPERRDLSMIFQSYALWPHMTIRENVAYPLTSRARKLSKTEIDERVDEILSFVHISELAQQYPSQMSGGQQQRVALARALVGGSDLVLFDEPLSNVDAKVREQLRFELITMQRELGFSAIYVTHDQQEAMGLAHRIAVLGEGKIAQIGSPLEIYDAAHSRYVANFVGTSNEIPGTVTTNEGDSVAVATELGELHGVAGEQNIKPGEDVVVMFRPERGTVTDDRKAAENYLRGIVEASMFLGAHTEYNLRIGSQRIRLWSVQRNALPEGAQVGLAIPSADLRILRR